jgi:hypothetical protein
MMRHPQSPGLNADTLSIVLLACLERQDVAGALRVVHDATRLSVPIHVDAVQKLIDLLQELGLQDAAIHLSRTLAEQRRVAT